MNALLHFIKLNVLKALNYIRWPRWYFAGALIGLVLISNEIMGTWFGWGWLMLGLAVWAYEKVK